MKLIYPAIFHKENNSYWVEFPDLVGCQSFGDTLKETLANAQEVLGGYAITLIEQGKTLATPCDILSIKCGKNEFVSLVECSLTNHMTQSRAIKKTLTIPQWLNDRAVSEGVNFSGVLQNALIEQLGIQK